MKIRLEFAPSRSTTWSWIRRECAKQPSYRVAKDDGVEVHSLDFTEASLKQALWFVTKLRGWKSVTITIDSEPVSWNEAWTRVYRLANRRADVDGALDQLSADLNTKLKDAGVRINIRHTRRQAKAGPDPELGF